MLNAGDLTHLQPSLIFAPHALENTGALIAAVSGGSDSLALLFLLYDYLTGLDNPPRLLAVTVDHRLRPESTAEAENVGRLCQRFGIEHQILSWTDPKPAHGIAAAAREARYRLLLKAAREAHAACILTGHTRNDQIETYLMRKARSQGAASRGLAAMADNVTLEGTVQLLRPFLGITREALRVYLRARDIPWVDDPSNVNIAYERPRIRLNADKEQEERILAEIAAATAARKRDNDRLTAALADPASLWRDAAHQLHVDAAIFASLPESVQSLFAGLVTALAGGRRFMPGEAERSRIAHFLTTANTVARMTQGGALITRAGKNKTHIFRREQRNLPMDELAPHATIIWDGRYRLHNEGTATVTIAPADSCSLAAFLERKGIAADAALRRALCVAPVIYHDGAPCAFPLLEREESPSHIRISNHYALFDYVLSGHDSGLAKAVRLRLEHK